MAKKKINSRAKGKRGELEASKLLMAYGFKARRAQQFSGQDGSQDLVHDVPGVHIEVKYVERLNVREAMAQAERDCQGKVPVVLHRSNGEPWLVTMHAEEFLKLKGGEDFNDL